MSKLVEIIARHVRDDFHWRLYGSLLIFLSVAITTNFSLQLENNIIDDRSHRYIRILFYFLLYGTGYFLTCWLIRIYRGTQEFWQQKRFWILSLLGLIILSVDKGFPYTYLLIRYFSDHYSFYVWLHQLTDHLSTFLWVLIPLMIVYHAIDRIPSRFYGLGYVSSIQSYWSLLWLMLPLIGIATLNADFIQYYPMYKSSGVHELMNWPAYVPALSYELAYGLSFINVELLFRGFFVIGMSQVLGKNAILPMVTIYCFLHFGKPIGECISSIFGGYLLGILAYQTRSIWGGIMVHIGIAWMMELAAYSVKVWSNS